METYDVCVVGQGPSGGMAAYVLARAGHSVLTFDRKREVGDPIHCGEGLGHIALEHTGLPLHDSWHQTTVKGNRIWMPNHKWVGLMGTGYTIDRHRFDQHLSDLAVDAGAQRHVNVKVTKVHRRTKGVGTRENFWLIDTPYQEFKAKQVVCAEGRVPLVTTQLGLQGNPRETLLQGLQYKFRPGVVDLPQEPYLDFYLDKRFQNGYVWVFPRADDLNVGICGDGDIKTPLKRFCQDFLQVDPDKRYKQTGGLIPRAGPIGRFSVEDGYVVGDAAGLTNPITKGGVHVGMLSAQLAAHAIRMSLEGPDTDSRVPDHALEDRKARQNIDRIEPDTPPHEWYERALRTQPYCSQTFIDESKIIYSLDEQVMNYIGDIFDGNNYTDLPYLRLMKVLARHPGLIPLANKLLKIRKNFAITERYGW